MTALVIPAHYVTHCDILLIPTYNATLNQQMSKDPVSFLSEGISMLVVLALIMGAVQSVLLAITCYSH